MSPNITRLVIGQRSGHRRIHSSMKHLHAISDAHVWQAALYSVLSTQSSTSSRRCGLTTGLCYSSCLQSTHIYVYVACKQQISFKWTDRPVVFRSALICLMSSAATYFALHYADLRTFFFINATGKTYCWLPAPNCIRGNRKSILSMRWFEED